jgi:hypothetical protein
MFEIKKPVQIGFAGIIDLLSQINNNLNLIELYLRPEGVAQRIEFYTIINGQEVRVQEMFLQQGQNAALKLAIKDIGGNPAKVQDDKVEWAMSDDTLGVLEIAEGGMSALFKPNGKVGALKIQAKGDADLGEGVKEIVGEIDIEVLGGEAVVMELSAEAVPAV